MGTRSVRDLWPLQVENSGGVARIAGRHTIAGMDELPAAAALETHVSWLFFTPELVFKVKKPVRTGFLDFSYPPSRARACADEVRLNRRLAPDVYQGVARLMLPNGDEETMVVMRRLPQDRCLSRLVGTDDPALRAELTRLVDVLQRFHAGADRSGQIDAAGHAGWVRHLWEHNLAEMSPFRGTILDGPALDDVETRALGYVHGREVLFESRIRSRRICDGHGDLLADDVYLMPDGPRVLDCLEFDPKLRWGDVLADVAFLAMDLERLGRPDLAAAFLDAYREVTGDDWPPSLVHHWVAYRALVRAKVAALRAAQGDPMGGPMATELLQMSLRHLREATVRVVLVGGAPGVGKSTIAAALSEATGALLIRSDELRKELLGLPPSEHIRAPFGRGPYRRALTDRVYGELIARAVHAVALGRSVILDATWAREQHRELAAEAAARASFVLVPLHCTTTDALAAARLEARAVDGADASDATADIARRIEIEPWPAATMVDTGGTVAETVARAARVVEGATAPDAYAAAG